MIRIKEEKEDKNLSKVESKIDKPQHYYHLTVAYLFLLRRVTKINLNKRSINNQLKLFYKLRQLFCVIAEAWGKKSKQKLNVAFLHNLEVKCIFVCILTIISSNFIMKTEKCNLKDLENSFKSKCLT